MKIKVKIPKPRNPLAVPVKLRKAGAHDAHNPARRSRRAAKHSLYILLKDRKNTDGADG